MPIKLGFGQKQIKSIGLKDSKTANLLKAHNPLKQRQSSSSSKNDKVSITFFLYELEIVYVPQPQTHKTNL